MAAWIDYGTPDDSIMGHLIGASLVLLKSHFYQAKSIKLGALCVALVRHQQGHRFYRFGKKCNEHYIIARNPNQKRFINLFDPCLRYYVCSEL